jgi:hypothetical protein
MLNVFETEVEVQAYKYMQEIAYGLTSEARDILDTQAYQWVPLTEKYREQKERQGLDTRTLIATGFYRDHIDWGTTGEDKIWFGVEDIDHEPSGLPLRILARIHEFGTATIPARQLWRPLLSKYIKQSPRFAKRYRKEIERQVKRAKT